MAQPRDPQGPLPARSGDGGRDPSSAVLAPVFIHGILPRCGSNFLWELLLLHPDAAPAVAPVREDLFLQHSDHLVDFAASVQAAWDPAWGVRGEELPARLLASLGEGLESFLRVDPGRRLVSKSPTVRNLDRFFDFFPNARLLVLVRDGRDVAQSCIDTFGWTFERAAREWARAADTIVDFRARREPVDQWRLVRYEDLVSDLDRQLPDLFQFAGLDPARYEIEAAHTLPVRGSSSFRGSDHESVHWEPVPKDSTFSPTGRWAEWDKRRLQRFAWLAGEQMHALGYDIDLAGRSSLPRARHRAVDLGWAARDGVRSVRRGLAAARRRGQHAAGRELS